MPSAASVRRLTTIVAADVAAFSRLTASDEEGTIAALRSHRTGLIDPKIAEYRGRIANTAGDSFLIEFPSVVEAIRFAVDVQSGMVERNINTPEGSRIKFRVGINVGDVMEQGDDLLGDGVNVAARIEGLAKPGGICISHTARDQVRDRVDIALEDMGEVEVKNIARPIRVFRVLREGQIATSPGRFELTKSWPLVATMVLIVVIAGGTLWWWQPWVKRETTLLLPDKPSIAVLPFRNMSGDPKQEYFADGMAEDIIIDLSKLSGVMVIARNSSFRYKGKSINIKSIGRELGVRYVVEGSVRRSSDKVRITARLIDTSTGGHIWAERYDRSYNDLFEIQDEVLGSIISQLAVQLSEVEQIQMSRIPTQNLEAYDYYLRAEQGRLHMTRENIERTVKLYEKAIMLDPKFAEAYAGYAQTQVEGLRRDWSGALTGASARKRAYSAASSALKLHPDNARSHVVLSLLQLIDGHHNRAIESIKKAIKLRPGDAETQFYHGLVLSYSGRLKDAVAAIKNGLRLSPEAPGIAHLIAGIVFYSDRQYDEAVEALEAARSRLSSSWTAYEYLAAAYAYADRTEAAAHEVKQLHSFLSVASIAYYRAVYTYYARKEDLDHHFEGLRRAGMPEWPFGLTPLGKDRLDDIALRKLTFGRSWKGRHAHTGTQFVQENTESGDFAYRSSASFQTGTISVENGKLCQRVDGYLSGQKLCGFVYPNDDSNGKDDIYVYVNVESVKYFSLANQ